MRRARACLVAVAFGACAMSWAPQTFDASTQSREALLAALARAAGASDAGAAGIGRIEHLTLRAAGKAFPVTLTVRGADFRFETVVDGATYAAGRCGGIRWRRTASGVVHRIDADVGGDDLDRWPLAPFALDPAALAVAGSAREPVAADVVAYRPATDSPHWFYVAANGDVVREISREGSRTVTVTFDDFRRVGAMRRAFAWHISGAGGPADVTIDGVRETPVAEGDVAILESAAPPFTVAEAARDDGADERPVRASFASRRIVVDARIDGRPAHLLLDTGTPQIILDAAFVRALHRAETLGHASVGRIDVGPFVARNVALATAPLDWRSIDGILGYDFFLGNVVHIDYARGRLGAIPRERFVPQPTMHELEAPAVEGMPIVAARFGDLVADRFVLDTGSYNIVVLQRLLDSVPGAEALGIDPDAGPVVEQPYYEGSIFTRQQAIRSLGLAHFDFRNVPAQVEVARGTASVRFPIDGILGTELLGAYEWWFDESGGRVWFR